MALEIHFLRSGKPIFPLNFKNKIIFNHEKFILVSVTEKLLGYSVLEPENLIFYGNLIVLPFYDVVIIPGPVPHTKIIVWRNMGGYPNLKVLFQKFLV